MALASSNNVQRQTDRRRLQRALTASMAGVLVLWVCFVIQKSINWTPLTVTPHTTEGLLGLLTAPLLHGSVAHILANTTALLLLGTLAGTAYPKATLRALPLLWLGSGLGAWLLGVPGSHHLGASGVTHGLGFLVFTLGLMRRDKAAIAAGMIAFFFYGGMLMTVLPHEAGVSWESHLGGALAGILAALLFRRADPISPRKKYSWEIEEELEAQQRSGGEHETFEPPAPNDVPVIWQHAATHDETRSNVLPFQRRE